MRARTVAGSCALAFAAAWNLANVGPVAERLREDYRIALATVGLLTTALVLGHLVSQIPAGRAIDAQGARRVGLASLAWIAACNGVLLAAPDPALALVVRALTGLGTGAGFVAGSDYARTARTPLALGLMGGASIAGSGFAVAAVPLLDGWLDWRAPYWSALLLALAAVPVLAAGPDDSARERAPRAAVIADRHLLRLGAVHAATFGLSVVVANWIVSVLTRGSGYGDERAGLVGSLVLSASLVTRMLGGEALRRRPELGRVLIVSSSLAGAAGVGVVAAVAPIPLGVALAASLAVGLAAGLPFAPVFGGAARARPDAPGAAVGFVNAIAVLAVLAGTPLAGLAFSLPGDGRIGFAAISALWAAAFLVLPRREAELG